MVDVTCRSDDHADRRPVTGSRVGVRRTSPSLRAPEGGPVSALPGATAGKLLDELCFVFQTAQIEPQRAFVDRAQDRNRQVRNRFSRRLSAPPARPLQLASSDEGRARQQIDRQRTAADLTLAALQRNRRLPRKSGLSCSQKTFAAPPDLRLSAASTAAAWSDALAAAPGRDRAGAPPPAPRVSSCPRAAPASVDSCASALPDPRRPTMMPACGPPSSLSPLKVTRSAPAAMHSLGIGSFGRPNRVRSTSDPLPRSTASGNAVTVRERGQLALRHRGGEALDRVIARVDLHDDAGPRTDRLA